MSKYKSTNDITKINKILNKSKVEKYIDYEFKQTEYELNKNIPKKRKFSIKI